MDKIFSEQVYSIVKQIPAGKVMTYGQLACAVGRPRAGRLIGVVLSRAPEGEGIPCHRVINRLGALAAGDVFGGSEVQRFLLESEGVCFLPNGRVDLSLCLWEKDFI